MKSKQTIAQTERRFILPLTERRLDNLPVGRTYEVTTYYLDTKRGTWSVGKGNTKIRLRVYDGKRAFLERKYHANNRTKKTRTEHSIAPPKRYRIIGWCMYVRSEYLIEGTRVTIDRELTATREADFIVVEVKGKMPERLRFIEEFEQPKFSKYKWLNTQ